MGLLKLTLHHIRRSPFQSAIAFLTVFTCFFILNFFLLVNRGLSGVLNHFESKPEITIFLKDGLDEAKVESIQKELASYPEVKEIRYISKEKALSLYKEMNKDNPLLTEMVTASILPASFEVSAFNPKVLEDIAQNFSSKKDIVDEIIYQKDIIQSLLSWTKIIRQSGLVLISVSVLIVFVMIFTLIGMKINNRKDEIKISRLLGASKFYVKRPFLLEGVIYGFFGSLLGFLLSFLIIYNLRSLINAFFQPIIFVSELSLFEPLLLAIEILLGILIGLSASWLGARRYIKW
ncbi:MAG: permease-like cell division protein FtsX [Candidatus Shapirobacteria bacterium]|nr:permease-like cell division protein FtsX [Candidatus Shapirobacteria bacterium]